MIIVKQNTNTVDGEHAADIVTTSRVNTVGAVMESDIPNQSFTNLLKNGDFESWSNGASSAPDGWTLSSGGTVARDTSKKIGTYSAKVTGGVFERYISQQIPDYSRYAGKKITITIWGKISGGAGRIVIEDGSYPPRQKSFNNTSYELISFTYTVDASPTKLEIQLTAGSGSAYFDGAILVEGEVCPAFSPKPLVDDGIMLQSNTPSAANDYGKAGQWCYDANYIYICTATDTWKRVAISTW